jgi:hypothetical protein
MPLRSQCASWQCDRLHPNGADRFRRRDEAETTSQVVNTWVHAVAPNQTRLVLNVTNEAIANDERFLKAA